MKIVDVVLKDDSAGAKLVFSDGAERLATETEKQYFEHRKKLKAALVKKKGDDGNVVFDEQNNPVMEYKVFRWADYHRHSWYSLLDGCVSIKDMVDRTEFAGGITDHGVMCGVPQFYAKMMAADKLPLIGEEFYCETQDGEKNRNHLILLAKNETGYKNLVKLSTESYSNFYRKPHISYKTLEEHKDGLICTSACIGGEIPSDLRDDKAENAEKAARWFQKTFGEDFYIEIQRHGFDEEEKTNLALIALARKLGIKLVAATDTHYLEKTDFEAHEVLLCISTGKTLADKNRLSFQGTGYHLYTADEMEELFSDIPEALDNTLEIAEKCKDIHIETGKYYLPEYKVPDGYANEFDYLYELAKNGFVKRYAPLFTVADSDTEEQKQEKLKKKREYWDRFNYEMNTIKKMGFAGYFLIVWDFLNYAHENQIPTGPGRGSGAGSMVLYCLQITDLDPMKYGLLFERFLNPDRISMPDIDSDLSESKRELVIDYVTQKYGSDHVAHIVTQGTLAAKSAIRDVAKVYGLSPSEAQRITKMIPDGPKVTIRKALEESPEFQAFAESSPMNQKIVQVAKTLEGTPRNLSTHACGICISREPMDEYLPELVVMDKQDGATVSTQYNMTECEDAGVLKMDFLGLRTLDVIDSTLKEIRAGHPDFTMKSNEIPVNDPMVYRFMAGGNTDGVFQFESDGMKRLLADVYQDIQETDTEEKGEEYFERLIAAVALYRPGPMDEIPKFIEAMRSGNIQYDHPKLKDILGNTYGVLVYQEQIMFAVRVLAGFTAGQSDKIRKAMGKKKLDIMEEYGEYFLHGSGEHDRLHPESPYGIKGCVANGIPEATAQLIWDKMVKFASYAFNKSHAACYALLAARTAWLSYYYPVECLSGILNSYLGNAEKLTQYIKTCTERKIRLLQPDVNKSLVGFHIEKDGDAQSIRFGLTGIKNVGAVAARAIVDERTIGGDFTSLENFIERMAKKGMDKTTLNALICTGALDCFPGTRSAKIVSFENMVKILTQVKKSNEDQMSFFDDTNEEHYLILPDVEEMSVKDIATLERDYLGLFVHHPVDAYKDKLDRWRARGMLSTIEGSAKALKAGESKTVRLCGFVENKELKTFRKKDGTSGYVLKFTIDDGSGSVRCIAFNQDATNLVGTVQNNQVVYANGKLESNEFGISYKVTNVFVLG